MPLNVYNCYKIGGRNMPKQKFMTIAPLFGEYDTTLVEEQNPYLQRLNSFCKERLLAPKFKLISLFCGGGGLDLGLGFAGFESLVISDLIPSFVETVTHNLPFATGLPIDALKLTGQKLLDSAGSQDIDLIAAGPSCQAFSILGRRGALDDPRGKLALKYFELGRVDNQCNKIMAEAR